MHRTITMILLCCVALTVAALFTVTQLSAGGSVVETMEKKLVQKYEALAATTEPAGEKPDLKIGTYKASAGYNEITVHGLKKRYYRDEQGCAEKVEFFNDRKECTGECKELLAKCQENKDCNGTDGWVAAITPGEWPKIWDEYLVGAGSTQGESGAGACVEWRFTVAGSPGWDCDYIGGNLVCSCIGYYVPPPYDMCCQPRGCRKRP